MIKSLILLAFLIVATPQAFAGGFAFDKTKCLLASENAVRLAIGSESMTSNVRIELVFKGSYVLMPRLQATFLTHEPAKAYIEWKSVIGSRKNLRQFRNEIFDQVLAEDGKPFAMKRISPAGQVAVFETAPLNLARTQNMVALFLSQGEFTVHAVTDQGDDWAGTFPLQMSDSSYRELAAQCYGDNTSLYVRGKGQRVDIQIPKTESPKIASSAIHWSEGYGLTEFTRLTALIPTELKAVSVFSETDSEDTANQKQSSWIQALSKKAQAHAQLKQLTENTEYTAVNQELAVQFDTLMAAYDRFVVLTGNNSQAEGIIEAKMKYAESLGQQLAVVESGIAAAQTQLDPIAKSHEDTVQQMAPFTPTILDFDAKTAALAKRIAEIQSLQAHLQTLVAEHIAVLSANGLEAAVVEGPWSLEEIEKKDKDVDLSLSRIETLTALQSQVAAIAGNVETLIQKAAVQQQASMAYLDLFAQQANLKMEIAKEKAYIERTREVPNFTVASPDFFAALNTSADQYIAEQLQQAKTEKPETVRDYKWEFDAHSRLYNNVEGLFVADVQKLQSENSIIASILCHPDVLKDERNRKKPCLIIDAALDDKTVENFFENLPPADIDALLGDVPRPWNQEKSKIEVLFAKYQNEIANPSPLLQKLVDTWGNLRQVIWRWVAMQKKAKALDLCGDASLAEQLLPGGIYTDGFYGKVIECERADVKNHEARYAELGGQLEAQTANINNAYAQFQAADQDFDASSRDFVFGTIEKLKATVVQTEASRIFTKCLIPLEKAEECNTAIMEVASGELVSREKQAYFELVKAMVGNINARIALHTQENAAAVAESQKLADEKHAYIAQNNVTELLAKKEELTKQIEAATKELEKLKLTKATSETDIAKTNSDLVSLRGEAQSLMGTMSDVSQKIAQTLPALAPHCSQIVPALAASREAEQALYKIIGQTKELPVVYESSCQRPDLNTFVPNQKSLTLTGTVTR